MIALEMEQNKINKVNSTSGSFTQANSLTACLELNACSTGWCFMAGLDGTITLETEINGDQNLKLSASLYLGAAIGPPAGKKFFTIYLGGGVEWNWKIKGKTYATVYEAIAAAIKDFVGRITNKQNTIHKKVIAAAEVARTTLTSDEEEMADYSETAEMQKDELTGLRNIHYQILRDYETYLRGVTDNSQAEALLHLAIFKAVWNPAPKRMPSVADQKTNKKKLDALMSDADLKCSKLNKPESTGKIRAAAEALGIDNTLLCSLLKYGTMMEPKDRKREGLLKLSQGSKFNAANSVKHLYPEICPGCGGGTIPEVQEALAQWFQQWDKVATADWIAFDTKTIGPNEILVQPRASVAATTAADPCETARQLFQALAAGNQELVVENGRAVAAADRRFTLVEITGSILVGVTAGSSQVGYCTADQNLFQMQLVYSRTYDCTRNEWKKGNVILWIAFSAPAVVRAEFSIELFPNPGKVRKVAGNVVFFWKTNAPTDSDTGKLLGDAPQNTLFNVMDAATIVIAPIVKAIQKHRDNSRKQMLCDIKAGLKASMTTESFNAIAAKLPPTFQPEPTSVTGVAGRIAGFLAQAAARAALSLSPFNAQTIQEIYLGFEQEDDGKFKVGVNVANTVVNTIQFGVGNFYVILGNSFRATRDYENMDFAASAGRQITAAATAIAQSASTFDAQPIPLLMGVV